jgi:hypothetical protein
LDTNFKDFSGRAALVLFTQKLVQEHQLLGNKKLSFCLDSDDYTTQNPIHDMSMTPVKVPLELYFIWEFHSIITSPDVKRQALFVKAPSSVLAMSTAFLRHTAQATPYVHPSSAEPPMGTHEDKMSSTHFAMNRILNISETTSRVARLQDCPLPTLIRTDDIDQT